MWPKGDDAPHEHLHAVVEAEGADAISCAEWVGAVAARVGEATADGHEDTHLERDVAVAPVLAELGASDAKRLLPAAEADAEAQRIERPQLGGHWRHHR